MCRRTRECYRVCCGFSHSAAMDAHIHDRQGHLSWIVLRSRLQYLDWPVYPL